KKTSQKIAELIKLENMTRSLTETEDIHNLIFGRDQEAIVKARLELARDKESQKKKNKKETLRQETKKPGSVERKWR
ncbi:27333_t:CDS:2, partial [Gigaspora margarita]